MGFLGLGRVKWKHADPEIRLRAVHGLDQGRESLLADIARSDTDPRVRAAAAGKVNGAIPLQGLMRDGDDAVRRIARERLSASADHLLRTQTLDQCGGLLESIADQKSLADLSLHARDQAVRRAAFQRLLAQPEPSPALLATVAIQDPSGAFATRAVAAIVRRGVLKDVARKAKHESARTAAQARWDELSADDGKPSSEQVRRARIAALRPLIDRATRLAVSSDRERAEREWAELDREREAALGAHAGEPDAEALAIIDRVARAKRDYTARRDADLERSAGIIAARQAMIGELEAMTAGGDDPQGARQGLLARWRSLGDTDQATLAALDDRFRQQMARLFAKVPVPAPDARDGAPASPTGPSAEDAAELARISAEAEALVESSDHRAARHRYQDLHKRWSQLAADLAPGQPLRSRFVIAYDTFKRLGRERREQRQSHEAGRRDQLTALAVEAETVAREVAGDGDAAAPGVLDALDRRLRDLQARWKAVGPLRPAIVAPLRERWRAALDQAYAPLRAQREASDWERFNHLAKAEELIASVEALGGQEDPGAVARAVKEAHAAWKRLGPLPRDRQQAAWESFKTACDAQFDRCRPWFAEQDAQRAGNLAAKRALLAEYQDLIDRGPVGLAGSPADLASRRASVERAKAIQQEWRGIGPVPREHDRDLWRAWRDAGDAFWSKHKADLAARDAGEQQNLERKLALCASAEQFAQTAEDARTHRTGLLTAPDVLRRAKSIQEEWKAIGHVPRQQVEAVWQRFRAACDRIYATVKEHREAQEAERVANLAKKQALLAELDQLATEENARWYKEEVRAIQGKWRDIGPVPRDDADALNRRFAELCDRVLAP